jgi:hypothetical protein
MDVRKLATPCNFGMNCCKDFKLKASEEFVLHQIVFGTSDLEVQAEFLKQEKLDIDRASKIAIKFESIRSAQKTLSGEAESRHSFAVSNHNHHERGEICGLTTNNTPR